MPPLFGMLVVGILLRNIPYVNTAVTDGLDPGWSSVLRKIALSVILLRAGLLRVIIFISGFSWTLWTDY